MIMGDWYVELNYLIINWLWHLFQNLKTSNVFFLFLFDIGKNVRNSQFYGNLSLDDFLIFIRNLSIRIKSLSTFASFARKNSSFSKIKIMLTFNRIVETQIFLP